MLCGSILAVGLLRTLFRKPLDLRECMECRLARWASWEKIKDENVWGGPLPTAPTLPRKLQAVCTGQELCLQSWLGDSGHPHSGRGGIIRSPARTYSHKPATDVHMGRWSGQFTWPGSTLVTRNGWGESWPGDSGSHFGQWSYTWWGFSGGSVVKNPPANCRRHGFDPLSRKIPWRKKW